MDHLDVLESRTIYILREAFNKIDKLAMLWSIGKDSNVMLWCARKLSSDMCRFRCSISTRARSFRRCMSFAIA